MDWKVSWKVARIEFMGFPNLDVLYLWVFHLSACLWVHGTMAAVDFGRTPEHDKKVAKPQWTFHSSDFKTKHFTKMLSSL